MSMTKPDYNYYKKEIMDSLKGRSNNYQHDNWRIHDLEVPLQDVAPSAKLDINDAGKLGLGIVGGLLVKDYTVSQKWINPL